MTATTVSPISITQIIPYSLLENGKKPTFGNRSVEKFLLSATESLQQARPDNISLVIAIAPGQKLVNEPWQRHFKPDAITFYTFYKQGNAFGAIETLSKIVATAYGENNILAMIDPYQILKDFRLLSAEMRGNLANSGCLLYLG